MIILMEMMMILMGVQPIRGRSQSNPMKLIFIYLLSATVIAMQRRPVVFPRTHQSCEAIEHDWQRTCTPAAGAE